ncbi:MAG: 2-phosphosulfolactate phosphatase [Trueperaceae bacterium]|nr:2-phosphosulfolactate phosphatase [Trueperaceae bacterium]
MLEVTDMELDVAFLPAGDPTDVAVVIDVLRMTTTAAALLAGGMRRLTIVAETDAALAHAASSGALLFGERMGLPYPGFDGGNSPVEHAKRDYGGRSAILCTTNGSKAVGLVAGARHVLLGAIVNAPAVARLAARLASERVTLVCAGTDGEVSLDDVLGAGCIATEVARLGGFELTDAARIAMAVAADRAGVGATLASARHAHTLSELGFAEDVEYAARLGSVGGVARLVGRAPFEFEAVTAS